jgi:hypothetical protein
MKREELIAPGSVILHEIYFGALGGEGDDPPTGLGLAEALERDFGSLRAWHTECTSSRRRRPADRAGHCCLGRRGLDDWSISERPLGVLGSVG